ncbi:MAG: hypothetical protein K2F63_04990, partial [Muribaculaceae bacterium]|nr:hypothetical protein [Muribaculaceae bacterium]
QGHGTQAQSQYNISEQFLHFCFTFAVWPTKLRKKAFKTFIKYVKKGGCRRLSDFGQTTFSCLCDCAGAVCLVFYDFLCPFSALFA